MTGSARHAGAERPTHQPESSRFDGVSSRTFTSSRERSAASARLGLKAAMRRALGDPRFDFGNSHFEARLRDSLELKPQTGLVNGIPLIEGCGPDVQREVLRRLA